MIMQWKKIIEGCGFVQFQFGLYLIVFVAQLTTTVNVEYPHLLKKTQLTDMDDRESDPIQYFDLIVDKVQWHGRNFSIMEMYPCAR